MTVKLEDTGQESMELGFELPEPGISVCQFEEGITKRTNENSGKTTLQLPMIIDQAVEGSEDNEGKKLSHFVPIETEWGEKQLAGILTMTGLVNGFGQKFGGEVEATDEKFTNALKLKLPGKFIKVHHDIRKDNKGRDQVNIIKFEKFAKGKSQPSKPTPQEGEGAGGDDW